MDINKLSEWLKESGLVAISGEDLELIKDYIDDKCIIIIPKNTIKVQALIWGRHILKKHMGGKDEK